MNPLEKLVAHFEKFPGVGVRQAKRFVFHLLTLPPSETNDIAHIISGLSDSVVECQRCHRFFFAKNDHTVCKICGDENRDISKLLIVASDNDMEAIERSKIYDGYYFILGGTVPLLNNQTSDSKIRAGALKQTIEQKVATGTLAELILGFALNPDGENTSRFIESLIKNSEANNRVKISYLGRGLSTGSELEYADPETIKNALSNRITHGL